MSTTARVHAGAPPKTGRNADLDGLKFIAAASIVMLHVAGVSTRVSGEPLNRLLTSVCYAALFFFFCVSGYLHGSLGTRGLAWLKDRTLRLAGPYFAWSVVFVAWAIFRGQSLPNWWMITFFAGAHEVLWSLPMLVACAVLAESLIHTRMSRRVALVVLALLAAATALFAPPEWNQEALRQFMYGARWPMMYLLGMEMREVSDAADVRAIWAGVGGSMLLLGLIGMLDPVEYPLRLYTLPSTALYAVLAAGLVLAADRRARVGAESLAWGGRYLVGIYASHYLFLEVVAKLAPPTLLPQPVWIVAAWVAVFGGALLTSHLLSQWRYTRFSVA